MYKQPITPFKAPNAQWRPGSPNIEKKSNGIKRRIPGRFYPPYIPVIKKPIQQNEFNDEKFSDIVEIDDKEFVKDLNCIKVRQSNFIECLYYVQKS